MAELSGRLDLRSAQGRQTRILILGAGLSGLCAAMLVAREGYQVTVLERDPAVPPLPERADAAWEAWLQAAGARRPAEERADCGFVYYARHFRLGSGEQPAVLHSLLQNYDSLSAITLPADNGTWSVVLTTSSRDKALRVLREPARWHAALARYPLVAHWADGAPISGVDVMAGIEDRHRRLAVDGQPVATGVIAVGDAWACTNPSLGRGAALALVHARLLREPLYRATLWYDRHRLAEIDADIAGMPYRTDDQRWPVSKALFAASLVDPDLTRAYSAVASFIATPDEVLALPGVLDRVIALGMAAPQYPLPGPARGEL